MEQLLTMAEVAQILNVSQTTLRNWDKQGKLKALKTLGGHRRYPKSQIETIFDYTASQEENQDVNNKQMDR